MEASKWISRKKMGMKLSRRLSNVRNTLCVQARKAEDVVMRKRLGIDEERRVAEVGEKDDNSFLIGKNSLPLQTEYDRSAVETQRGSLPATAPWKALAKTNCL